MSFGKLLDDNFATIVAAIEEGRSSYENIQKFIRFLFSTNLALVLVVVGSIGSFALGLQDIGGGLLLPLTAVERLPVLSLDQDKYYGIPTKTMTYPQR